MIPSGEALEIQKTPFQVEKAVEKLTTEVKAIETIATSAGLISAGVGSVLAIPFGPFAFVSGIALAAVAMGGLKVFVQSKKKEIEKEIRLLQTRSLISEAAAAEIRERLGSIRTDNPSSPEASADSTTESTSEVTKQ